VGLFFTNGYQVILVLEGIPRLAMDGRRSLAIYVESRK